MKKLVESFDQFIQQASLSQIGDPRVFGLNPKKKNAKLYKSKTKTKPKQPVA
jgi:hypothetical protein